MSDSPSRLVLPEHLGLQGHRSASMRREIEHRQKIATLEEVIEHLRVVIIVALEERKGEPLLVTGDRRIELLTKGGQYHVRQAKDSLDVVYSLTAPAEEEAPPAPPPPETAS